MTHNRIKKKVVWGHEATQFGKRLWLPRRDHFPAGTAKSAGEDIDVNKICLLFM